MGGDEMQEERRTNKYTVIQSQVTTPTGICRIPTQKKSPTQPRPFGKMTTENLLTPHHVVTNSEGRLVGVHTSDMNVELHAEIFPSTILHARTLRGWLVYCPHISQ